MSKQYGLIVPNKDKPKPTPSTTTIQRPSIFDDSDDDDNDDNSNDKRPQIGSKRPLKKQDKINQQRAIDQDPTVYQYDEIYDDMDRKRKESKLLRKDLERKPKYINKLLEAAERRKKEYERRVERQIQKEREAEGEEFKDKESFVTSAYRRKLEEMKQMDELEKREEYLENIGDVRKQQNLDGFYRHLFQQKVNYDDDIDDDKHGSHSNKQQNNDQIDYDDDNKNSSHGDKQKNQDDDDCGSHSNKQNNNDDSDHSSNGNKQNNDNDKKQENIKKSQFKQRQYRKRDNSNNSDIEIDNNPDNDDNDKIDNKKEHLPSNLDADSDFSIDSSTDDDDDDDKDKDKNKKQSIDVGVKQEKIDDIDDKQPTIEEINVKKQDGDVKMEEIVVDAATPPPVKKPKIDIWKKRTIDDVYQAALQRYFERKALRDL